MGVAGGEHCLRITEPSPRNGIRYPPASKQSCGDCVKNFKTRFHVAPPRCFESHPGRPFLSDSSLKAFEPMISLTRLLPQRCTGSRPARSIPHVLLMAVA